MRVRVDRNADTVYVNLTGRAVKNSREVADGVTIDYDADGHMVGVRIGDVSQRTNDPGALKGIGVEMASDK
jgi:uncharacterized protein YuzE